MKRFSLFPWTAFTALVYARSSDKQQVLGGDIDSTATRLNFSDPHPLIFHSTFSLLQQWPNSFFPNGHTVAPCTIPRNTNLYHAHPNSSFPPSPEWFAFDAAMAYSIMGGFGHAHLLTFRTAKDVKCIYFDGTSATLMGDGSMDSQMLVIHNNSHNVPEPPLFPPGRHRRAPSPPDDGYPYPVYPEPYAGPPNRNWSNSNPLKLEYDRAAGLCEFIREKSLGGPGWGYEGIVRMNAAFELIWCNFTSPSAKLVSWLNVTVPALEDVREPWDPPEGNDGMPFKRLDNSGPPRRGRDRRLFLSQPFIFRSAYDWFHAAAKTYGFAGGNAGIGESRVHIDSCGLFTFYDPALQHQSRALVENERHLLNLTSDGIWKGPSHSGERSTALDDLGRRRRYQRATNISVSDGLHMRQEIESRMRDVLHQDEQGSRCSGIDWVSISRTIVSDYSSELFDLHKILSNNTNQTDGIQARFWLSTLRGATHSLMMPYYEYPSLPIPKAGLSHAFSSSSPQSVAAFERCKSQHDPIFAPGTTLLPSEKLTLTSIQTVLTALCTSLLHLFLTTEILWLMHFNSAHSHPGNISLPYEVQHKVERIAQRDLRLLEELMAWLGWTEQWTGCDPGCGLGQVCSIPIWPVMGIGHFSGGPFGMDAKSLERELWEGARCVDAESSSSSWVI